MANWVGLVGRVLIAFLFLAGAVQKSINPDGAMALLAMRGLPEALVWPALVYDAAAGLLLVAGLWLGPVAASLALYSIATSWFHFLPDDPWQMSIFVKNWAIAGGCLVLAADGGGNIRVRLKNNDISGGGI